MAVTTGPRKPVKTAKSLSDLASLVSQTTNPESIEMTTAHTSAAPSATSQEAAQQNLTGTSAEKAAALAASSAIGAEEAKEMEALVVKLLGDAVKELGEQQKVATAEIGEHIKTAIEQSVGKQVQLCIEDTAAVKKDLSAVQTEITQLNKRMDTMGVPAAPKELSRLMKTAAVVKDVGAYSGAALLAGVAVKSLYDLFTRNSEE